MALTKFTNRLQKIEDYLRSPASKNKSSLLERIERGRLRCGMAPHKPLTEEEKVMLKGMGLAERLKYFRMR